MLQRIVLVTKLLPPKPGANILFRKRLLEPITNNLAKRFILVCAGPGYGKTTLLATLATSLTDAFVWYNLGGDDQDLGVFVAHLSYGIRQRHVAFGDKTSAALDQGSPVRNFHLVARTFINDIFENVKGDFYIILDDYHHVESATSINRFLEYLIDHLPPNVHLVVATRNYPPFSLARLRSRGDTFEVHTPEIRFTLDEAAAAYRGRLSPNRLRSVWEQFEGWITGIQFSLHIAEPGRDAPVDLSKEDMFDYFASEILSQQPRPVRSFLMRSSLLEVLTPHACDTILGTTKSGSILAYLVRKNLFVDELKDHKKYFKYHRLFKEFLTRQLLEHDAGESTRLHQAAARYYIDHGEVASGINHYLAAGDQHRAAAAITKYYRRDILARGWGGFVAEWMNRLDHGLFQQKPWLLYIKGSVLMYDGRWNEALDVYQKACRIFSARRDRLGQAAAGHRISVLYKRHGQTAAAQAAGQKAQRLCPARERELRAFIINSLCTLDITEGRHRGVAIRLNYARKLVHGRYRKAEAIILTNLGLISQITGDFAPAIRDYELAIALGDRVVLSGLSIIYNNLATVRMLLGQTEQARHLLQESTSIAQAYGEQRSLLTTFIAWSELRLYENDLAGFDQSIAEARAMNSAMNDREIGLHINLLLGRRHLKTANYQLARAFLEKANAPQASGFVKVQALLGLAELDYQAGRPRDTQRLLAAAAALSGKLGLKYFAAVGQLQLAFFLYRKRRTRVWPAHLARAVRMSQRHGYEPLLANSCREGMAAMFFEALRERRASEPIRQALSHCDARMILGLAASNDAPAGRELSQLYDRLARRHGFHLRITTSPVLKILLPGNDELPVHWYSRKHRQLFEFLITHPGPHPQDRLVEVVWPGSPLRSGLANLRSAVARLNRLFSFMPGLVTRTGPGYGLNPQYEFQVDYLAFAHALTEFQSGKRLNEIPAVAKLEQVVGTAPNNFLEDNYSVWAQECRDFLQGGITLALAQLGAYYLRTGQAQDAIRICRRLTRHEPFVESNYQQLFRALALSGDRRALDDAYQRMRDTFQKELQREPSCETMSLLERLRTETLTS